MRRARRLIVAAVVFALLAVICILRDVPRIEGDIRARTVDALARAGLAEITLEVSGRDVSLAGPQESMERALSALARVPGIRLATANPTMAAAAPPAAATPTTPESGPPPAEPESAIDIERRIRDLVVARPIRFRTGSAVLLPESRVVLDDLARLLLDTDFDIEIEGHTDATGSAQRNLALSQQRAESVMAYLGAQGVAARRMTATGVGSARPIASNATAAGRQRNRRIEFNITSPS